MQVGYEVDECGVCGGSGDSCALVLSLLSDSLASTSATALLTSQVTIFQIGPLLLIIIELLSISK